MSFVLFPEEAVGGRGCGPEIALGEAQGTLLELTLEIQRMMERQTLDVSVWGSEDGELWGEKPLYRSPYRFYCGVYRQKLDLRMHPKVRYLRIEYNLESWGANGNQRLCAFTMTCEAVKVTALAVAS